MIVYLQGIKNGMPESLLLPVAKSKSPLLPVAKPKSPLVTVAKPKSPMVPVIQPKSPPVPVFHKIKAPSVHYLKDHVKRTQPGRRTFEKAMEMRNYGDALIKWVLSIIIGLVIYFPGASHLWGARRCTWWRARRMSTSTTPSQSPPRLPSLPGTGSTGTCSPVPVQTSCTITVCCASISFTFL